MQIEDIKDHASFKAWLDKQQSAEVAAKVSARAALRLQPLVWVGHPPVHNDEESMWPSLWWRGLALVSFWDSLASVVVAERATDQIKTARRSAAALLARAYREHREEVTRFADRKEQLALEAVAHAVD